jgi:hypothetical protein
LVVLEFELRALHLLGRHSAIRATSPAPRRNSYTSSSTASPLPMLWKILVGKYVGLKEEEEERKLKGERTA